MNKLEIQGSGFPADNRTWRFVRDMINELHNITALGGDNYILKGCVDTAGTVSDGIMVLSGEIIPFTGGALGAEVTIDETVESVTYLEDINPADGQGDVKEAYFTRTARFGNDGVATFNWADLKPLNPILEIQRRLVPKKSAIPYWGFVADIDEGWQLCNGTNGTPDLSGLFIVGYDPGETDYDAVGKQGGAKEVALTEAQMPSHTHSGTVSIPPHKHQLPNPVYTKVGGSGDDNTFSNSNNVGKVDITETLDSAGETANITTAPKGGGTAHENRPPYYVMAYIAYVGV